MKTKLSKLIMVLIATMVVTLGCNSTSSDNNRNNNDTMAVENQQTGNIKEVNPKFKKLNKEVADHINTVTSHYIHVKSALVNANPDEATAGAANIAYSLKKFDKSLLTVEQQNAYNSLSDALYSKASTIAQEKNLEKQRVEFAPLSDNFYELIKLFETDKTLYHQHCPMAFDNKGAMWVSETKEIKNPYFGDKMLKCGSNEEVIASLN